MSIDLSERVADRDKVITPEEFSKRAGISITTIWRLRRRGELKFMQLSPRRIGIRLCDADAWLKTREAV